MVFYRKRIWRCERSFVQSVSQAVDTCIPLYLLFTANFLLFACSSRKIPGMLATCAVDKTVTLWDTYSSQGEPSNTPPHPCGNKDMGVGKLYTISFYPSSPWLLGCGGGGKEIALWDLSSESALQSRFGGRFGSGVTEAIKEAQKDRSMSEDFEAMMAVGDSAMDKVRKDAMSKSSKKGKGKKKVHRKGR